MILDDLIALTPAAFQQKSIDASLWFAKELARLRVIGNTIQEELQSYTLPPLELGHMYMYEYDAKLKEKLPYFDRFPVVIIIERYETGFLGINFHYIPPLKRAEVLDALLKYWNEEDDEIEMRYQLLKKISKLKWAKPCLKQYLYSHIGSRITEVPAEYWEVVVMLRTQQFNINANTVYKESRKKVNIL